MFAIASTSGSAMITLIALSSQLFLQDASGIQSAWLRATSLLGVVITGSVGGCLLSRVNTHHLGLQLSIFSACILMVVMLLPVQSSIILFSMFLLSCCYGLEHPNNMRTLMALTAKHERPLCFSQSKITICYCKKQLRKKPHMNLVNMCMTA